MERKYTEELRNAFEKKDKAQIGNILKTLRNEYYHALYKKKPGQELTPIEKEQRTITLEISERLEDDYELLEGLEIAYEEYNFWLLDLIVFNTWQRFFYEIHISLNMTDSNVEYPEGFVNGLINIVNKIATSNLYLYKIQDIDDSILTYDQYTGIESWTENDLKFLREYIISMPPKNIGTNEIEDLHKELTEKFVGNPLGKRANGNLDKYMKVAKLIKVFDEHFSAIGGIQKKACEIAECSEYSFSKWKNAKRKNADDINNEMLFDAWQRNIDDEDTEELKREIRTFLNFN